MTAKSPYPPDDLRSLRILLRKARKLSRRIERTLDDAPNGRCEHVAAPEITPPKEPEPPAPRWLLSGAQLQTIAKRLNLAEAGTYAEVATELGIEGDLYAMIEETFRAALHSGICPPEVPSGLLSHKWATADLKGEWLFSHRDAKRAYAWHLALANYYADPAKQQRSNDG